MVVSVRSLCTPLLVSFFCLPLAAQCGPTAVLAGTAPEADDAVLATCLWDPDGTGPLAPVVVVGGRFRYFGEVATTGLATFDPVTGDVQALGAFASAAANPAPEVHSLRVLANNDLVVGGTFTSVNGIPAQYLARWDGSAWSAYPSLPAQVEAIAEMPNGDLVVSGTFYGSSGAAYLGQIMRLGPSGWSAIALPSPGSVLSLDVMPNGDLLVAGNDVMPGGVLVARWDGSSWSTFGSGLVGPGVARAKVLANGNVLAYGLFTTTYGNPSNHVSIWDGSSWTDLGGGLSRQALSAIELANGDIVVGGSFRTAGGVTVSQVARWDGSAWYAFGGGLGLGDDPGFTLYPVRALVELPGGGLLAGGDFSAVNGDFRFVARWDGSAWGPLWPGTGGVLEAVHELRSGDVVVAGSFQTIEGVAASNVAVRSSGTWQALGAGVDGRVLAVAELPNGDVVVGGEFLQAGGVPAARVARWDGVAWQALATGLSATVRALAVSPSGQLLAQGDFPDRIAVWNGVSWNSTGVGAPVNPADNVWPQQMVTAPGGDVYAVVPAGRYVGRWNGSSWTQVTAGVTWAGPLLVLANGNIVCCPTLLMQPTTQLALQQVMLWDGSQWSYLASGVGRAAVALAELPDGAIVAGGAFSELGALPPGGANGLARWDGSSWQEFAGGVTGEVRALQWSARGRLHVVGDYWSIGSTAAAKFAAIESTCPGSVATVGAPCSGVGLAANSLPWTGGTFASTVSMTPSNGLVVEVYGLQPAATPIALPQSTCQLLVTPDFVRFAAASGAAYELAFTIPNQPSLVGTTFYQQALTVSLAANGAISAIAASNAFAATIGQY